MKTPLSTGIAATAIVLSCSTVFAFPLTPETNWRRSTTSLFAGRGFGKDTGGSNRKLSKTYGTEALTPIRDVIDTESALREFFDGYGAQWKPLFRAMIGDSIMSDGSRVPAMSWLSGSDIGADFIFDETSFPWKRLDGIPTDDGHRTVLGEFLDHVQASLIDIPVDETTKEDENDLHFLEEGRRMLVCSRFHVVTGKSRIDSFDELFATCWNEIYHLQDVGEADTGSLIVVPDSDLDDLRRFVDMNLQRPLQAMGLQQTFEVASMVRGSPAVRVIHKLSDMPTDLPEEPERMDADPEE